MSRRTTFFAWIVFLSAVCAWAGVGCFAYYISSLESAHTASIQSSQKSAAEAAQVSYLHKVVSSTADERAQLDSITMVDPSALANMVNTAGTSTGVDLKISNASAGNVSSVDGKTAAQTFSFLVTSQGSFSSVMYAAALLESLPVPSSVLQYTITHSSDTAGAAKGGGWQMNAQVQILSTSNTAS